jgi:hypothetical protein
MLLHDIVQVPSWATYIIVAQSKSKWQMARNAFSHDYLVLTGFYYSTTIVEYLVLEIRFPMDMAIA